MHRLACHTARWIMVGVLLLAYSVRAHHLDYQSFWSDEGISLLRSARPLSQMLAEMPIEHVPGYFVLLHFWLGVVGDNDYAVRFFSLWPSVLSVALGYRLALALSRRGLADAFTMVTALGGAFLLATSAFQVWYAQEARMYSWLLAASLAATLSFWQLHFPKVGHETRETITETFSHVGRVTTESNLDADKNTLCSSLYRWRMLLGWTWLGYVVSTTLTIYLHFYGFLVPIAHAVLALLFLVRTAHDGRVIPTTQSAQPNFTQSVDPDAWRRFSAWALAGLVVFLLFTPWLPRAIQLLAFEGWRPDGDPWQLPWRYLVAYTVGDPMPRPWAAWLPWGYLVLAIVGVIGWWRQRAEAALLLVVSLLLPFAVTFAQALRNPDFHERYTIILTVPLLLLAAGGLASLSILLSHRLHGKSAIPTFGLLLITPLLWANGLALHRLYTDNSLHKPDFRGAAQRIMQEERPGDVVLVDGPDPQKVFLHYYQGAAPVHDLRSLADASGEEIVRTLTIATQDADRAWELLYFHGPTAVQHWLALTAWATDPSYHNNIRVTLYGLPAQPMSTHAANMDFGPNLTLLHTESSATTLRPGDLLRLTTVWQVHQPAPDYKFSLRLLAADGAIVLARDYIPQNWFGPTSTWPVGQTTTDQHGLIIPPDLPPGRYQVSLRLYDPANGVAVETARGQDVVLVAVDVLAGGVAE